MNRISPARKILSWLGAALCLVLLTGCEFTLTNLTPATLAENPSNIYTLQVRAAGKASSIVADSIEARIVIDGRDFPMTRSSVGDGIFELDYQLPAGRDEMAYYYVVRYALENNGRRVERETFTEIQRTKVLSRNVVSLTANRGPVGARIAVLGRGFTRQDMIIVEGNPAQTVYESPNALAFYVPTLDANRTYRVALSGSGATTTIGTFRVDPSNASVTPTSLNLRVGERQPLTFNLSSPAPVGGMLIDVTTNIPDSVIMPEVVVRQGESSATVTVEGRAAGSGSLYVKGFGAGEISIPVTVTR